MIVRDRAARWSAPAESSTRVLIGSGHALARAAYRSLLDSDQRIEIVSEASSAARAVALATEAAPDVALLDLQLPGLDDLEAIAAIVSSPAFAGVAVLLITAPESDERVSSALLAGAVGVLESDAEPADLIQAVKLLARGHALLPAGAVRRLLAEVSPQSRRGSLPDQLNELTDRELEVVALAATGLSNREIAQKLVISPATAKTHVSRAMVKLHARNRAQLVVLAYQAGLVHPTTTAPIRHGANIPTERWRTIKEHKPVNDRKIFLRSPRHLGPPS